MFTRVSSVYSPWLEEQELFQQTALMRMVLSLDPEHSPPGNINDSLDCAPHWGVYCPVVLSSEVSSLKSPDYKVAEGHFSRLISSFRT